MCRPADRQMGVGARRGADRSGFTLVEVLVAFVVMAMVLSVLYRSTVQTRAGAFGFSTREEEETVALSLLAEFRSRRDLADGRYAGERDGRHWTLVASPIDLADQLPKGRKPAHEAGKSDRPVWRMQRLVLQVATAGRPLETEALHLVRPKPDAEAR